MEGKENILRKNRRKVKILVNTDQELSFSVTVPDFFTLRHITHITNSYLNSYHNHDKVMILEILKEEKNDNYKTCF